MIKMHEELLNISLGSSNSADKEIAKVLCDNFRFNVFLKIKELSKKCYVSEATITRFCKRLGLKGYNELITILKHQKSDFKIEIINNNKNDDENYFFTIHKNLIDEINTILFEFPKMNSLLKLVKEIRKVYIICSNSIYKIIKELSDNLILNGINSILFEDPILYNFLNREKINNNSIVVCFISGSNNSKILEIIRQYFKKMKNSFLFTSIRQVEHFKDYFFNVSIYNKNDNKNNYFYRNFIIQYIVTQLINKFYEI